jgi:hypothetical protein
MPRQMLAVLTRQLVASPAHDGASHSTAAADGGLLLRLGCISGSAAGDSGDFEKVAYDTQGNCWRISACGQQVERRDCYSRSTTWIPVDVVVGSSGGDEPLGSPWVALCTVATGLVYLTNGWRIWCLDGRRGPLPTDVDQRTLPPTQADYSGAGFAPGFGVFADTCALLGGARVHQLGRTCGGHLQITLAPGDMLEGLPMPVGRDGPPRVRLNTRPLPPPPTWNTSAGGQRWREVARLPGGGNHDVSCVQCAGEVWVAGGIGNWVGFPADVHLFEELWAYSPARDAWRVVTLLPRPTCFCGIAVLGSEIWVIGGADDRGAPRPVSDKGHDQRGVDGQPTRARPDF